MRGWSHCLYEGDVVFEGMTEDGEMLARLQRAKSQKVEYLKPMEGVNREEYLKQAGRMIDALQQKEARKAVLARGIVVETEAFRWASQWFEALALCYPDAFVFVVSVPSKMTWMGATPEILLEARRPGGGDNVVGGDSQKLGVPENGVIRNRRNSEL